MDATFSEQIFDTSKSFLLLQKIRVPFLKKVGQVKYKRVSFQVSAFGARRKKLKGNLAEKLQVDEEA